MNDPRVRDYGDFIHIAKLRIKLARLGELGLGDRAVLVLPDHVLAGATSTCGVPVVHADVHEPMIGLPVA
jgi:hypothetical protein